MAVEFIWGIDKNGLLVKNVGTNQDAVCKVNWNIVAIDSTIPYSYTYQQTTELDISKLTNFTPFSNLNNDQVIGWVQSTLGDDAVKNILTSITDIMAREAANAALKAKPVPWS